MFWRPGRLLRVKQTPSSEDRGGSVARSNREKCVGIQRLQFIGSRAASLDQHIHTLAGSHHHRIAWLQLVHVGDGDPVHRDDIQSVTFKRDEEVVALGRIQQSPPLHLTGSHVQCRVSYAIVRVVEEASPGRSIQAVGAPDTLLFEIRCAEGECPELLGILVDERHLAIEAGPDDLKHHRNVFGSGDLGHGIEGSRASLDDEESLPCRH